MRSRGEGLRDVTVQPCTAKSGHVSKLLPKASNGGARVQLGETGSARRRLG